MGEWNINVNGVSNSHVETEVKRETYTIGGANRQMHRKCIKRQAVPEELVGTVTFLASEESDFLTGQTIHVNGGVYFQ